jgi:HPt (histidine-containing phosphotransfer) domain-containing protein
MSITENTLSLPLLDKSRVERLLTTDGNNSFYTEMIGLFDTRSAELLAEIQAEMQNGKSHIRPQLHKLKGICYSLGAQRLAAICNEMEALSEAAQLTAADIDLLIRTTRDTLEAQKKLL